MLLSPTILTIRPRGSPPPRAQSKTVQPLETNWRFPAASRIVLLDAAGSTVSFLRSRDIFNWSWDTDRIRPFFHCCCCRLTGSLRVIVRHSDYETMNDKHEYPRVHQSSSSIDRRVRDVCAVRANLALIAAPMSSSSDVSTGLSLRFGS